jgi:hypothetical protein
MESYKFEENAVRVIFMKEFKRIKFQIFEKGNSNKLEVTDIEYCFSKERKQLKVELVKDNEMVIINVTEMNGEECKICYILEKEKEKETEKDTYSIDVLKGLGLAMLGMESESQYVPNTSKTKNVIDLKNENISASIRKKWKV